VPIASGYDDVYDSTTPFRRSSLSLQVLAGSDCGTSLSATKAALTDILDCKKQPTKYLSCTQTCSPTPTFSISLQLAAQVDLPAASHHRPEITRRDASVAFGLQPGFRECNSTGRAPCKDPAPDSCATCNEQNWAAEAQVLNSSGWQSNSLKSSLAAQIASYLNITDPSA
jgi:hypothetical protein